MTLENGSNVFKILHVKWGILRLYMWLETEFSLEDVKTCGIFYINYGIICICIRKVKVMDLDSQEVFSE